MDMPLGRGVCGQDGLGEIFAIPLREPANPGAAVRQAVARIDMGRGTPITPVELGSTSWGFYF